MNTLRRLICAAVPLCLCAPLLAQQPATPGAPIPQPRPMPAYPRMPAPEGFRLFITADMEGLGSVVFNREIIAGNEFANSTPRSTSPDYWAFYRGLLTREVNAVIAGARRGGARSFVVNEGHGGNLFANILPWDLDTAAILVRGFPKPELMTTGLDSSAGAAIFIGMHAGARTGGIIAHNYAFDSLMVNGRWLNETGINALVAGEYGVPVVMVTGDDVATRQAREQLGNDIITVTTKIAIGSSAGVTWSPAVVRQMMRDSALAAVAKARAGQIRPFTLTKPYTVDIILRPSYAANLVTAIDSIRGFPNVQKVGERRYRMVTSDAREMVRYFDVIEQIVIR